LQICRSGSCSSFECTGGGSGGSGGATCSDFFGNDADCKGCIQTYCCAESAACESDESCKSLVGCTRQCPDPMDGSSTCVQACAADAGVSNNYNFLQICRSLHCTSECDSL
jgi:hypothetical protein